MHVNNQTVTGTQKTYVKLGGTLVKWCVTGSTVIDT